MIYEKDLDESIARYLGEPDPTINTCIKLASCYVVKGELFGKPEQPAAPERAYSYASALPPASAAIEYDGETDFARTIRGKDQKAVWPVMDEVMEVLQTLYPELYANVIREIKRK